MKKKLTEKANELKIEYIGFCDAEKDEELIKILKKRRENFGFSPFEEEDLEKRVNPKMLMPEAKSVIVCLFPYFIGNKTAENLALYASVTDYHRVAQKKLNELAKVLGGYKYECFADNDPLCDRFLAYKAGLGFYGKNSMLINEKYGSYFAIGFILTDAKIESNKPIKKTCLGCDLCIKHCPGGAILQNFGFDYTNCLSYITQAKEHAESQVKMLKNSDKIVGCDICQSVCPHNEEIKITPIGEFRENVLSELYFDDIQKLSNREFKEKYKDYAFSWLGKKKILRNFTEKNK